MPGQLFLGLASSNNIQNQKVGNSLGVAGILLQRLIQRSLGLFCSAEVKLGNGLGDQSPHR